MRIADAVICYKETVKSECVDDFLCGRGEHVVGKTMSFNVEFEVSIALDNDELDSDKEEIESIILRKARRKAMDICIRADIEDHEIIRLRNWKNAKLVRYEILKV